MPAILEFYWEEVFLPMKNMSLFERWGHIYDWFIKSDILDSILITYFRSLCYNLTLEQGKLFE